MFLYKRFRNKRTNLNQKKDGARNLALTQLLDPSSNLNIMSFIEYVNASFPNEVSVDVSDYFDTNQEESDIKGLRCSIKVDSNGNNLTDAQTKFFEDSKIRDDEGRMQVMYHVSNKDYTVTKILDWFSNVEIVEDYTYEEQSRFIKDVFGEKSFKEYTNYDFGHSERYDRPTERGNSRSNTYHASRK